MITFAISCVPENSLKELEEVDSELSLEESAISEKVIKEDLVEEVSRELASSEESAENIATETNWMAKPSYHAYYFAPKIIQEIHNSGIEVYSVDTNLFGDDSGATPAVAAGPGVWDFSSFINILNMIAEINPKAKFIIRPYAGAPDWWKPYLPQSEFSLNADGCAFVGSKRQNGHCLTSTGEIATDSNSKRYVDLSSKIMMDHWRLGLSMLKSALVESGHYDNVIALTLTGQSSQEWISWDANFNTYDTIRPLAYGDSHRNAYKEWRIAKYGAVLDVPSEIDFTNFENKIGGSSFDALNSINNINVIHYYQFRSELTARTILELANESKKHFPNVKVGAIYGYHNEMGGNPTYGHNALGKLIRSPFLDFINPMSSYQDRIVGGADFERQPISSVKLHGKQVLNDLDQGTHLSKQIYDGPICDYYKYSTILAEQNHYKKWCNSGDASSLYVMAMSTLGFRMSADGSSIYEPSIYETVSNFRRFLGFSLARDIPFSYLSLHNDFAPGNERSYLSDPELLAVLPSINQVKEDSAKFDLSSNAEILVVSSEDSSNYIISEIVEPHLPDRSLDVAGLNYHAIATSRIGLNKLGAPYDHILLSDLDRVDSEQYKLIIFLNAWSISSRDRQLIEDKFKRDQKTIVWNNASGIYKDGQFGLQHASELIGINLVNGGGLRAPSININASLYPLFSQNELIAPRFIKDCCDFIYAADGTAAILGTYDQRAEAAMAIKSHGDWTSIWAATITLPGNVWRDIARNAGVHIYHDHNEPLYVNKSYLTLVSNRTGKSTLRFKSPVSLIEPISNQVIAKGVTSHQFDVVENGTYIFRVQE